MAVFDPTQFVLEQLAAGASEKDIRNYLSENHALLPDVSRRLIREVKLRNPEIMELCR